MPIIACRCGQAWASILVARAPRQTWRTVCVNSVEMLQTREEVAALLKKSGEKIREMEKLRRALADVQSRLRVLAKKKPQRKHRN